MSFAGKVNLAPGRTVRYDLYVTDTMVNFTGKSKHALAINGTLPGPDLDFPKVTLLLYMYTTSE